MSKTLNTAALAVLTCLVVGLTRPAAADTIYSATVGDTPGGVITSLTITSFNGGPTKPAGLIVSGDAFTFGTGMTSVGNASATATSTPTVMAGDPFDLMVGDGFVLYNQATGIASPPPFSMADSFSSSGGSIFIENVSGALVTIGFDLVFSYDLSATVTDPANEDAFASIDMDLTDITLTSLFSRFKTVDGEGTTTDSEAGTFSFVVSVADDAIESIALSQGANGVALNGVVVPEPSSIVLLGMGIVGLTGAAWRRRRA